MLLEFMPCPQKVTLERGFIKKLVCTSRKWSDWRVDRVNPEENSEAQGVEPGGWMGR